jgi:hypothetical protein
MSKTVREIAEMIFGHRGFRWLRLFWAMVLAASVCLAAAGCGWTPRLSPGPIGPASWLTAKPGSKAESEALKKRVEADSFPTAAQAGA